MKFNVLEKLVPQNDKLKEIVEDYKKKCYELFGQIDNEKDVKALEELALEAASGSPEMLTAFKQVLQERGKNRNKNIDQGLAVDESGLLVGHKEDFLSGERQ